MNNTSKKNAESNGREAATEALFEWGKGWSRLSSFQKNDTAAGELLLTIESMSDEALVEQFGSCVIPGFQVVRQMIAALQRELGK